MEWMCEMLGGCPRRLEGFQGNCQDPCSMYWAVNTSRAPGARTPLLHPLKTVQLPNDGV